MNPINLVLWTPLIFALLTALFPRTKLGLRIISLFGAAGSLLFALILFFSFDSAQKGPQFHLSLPWIPAFGASYEIGVDGLSLGMLLLSTLILPILFALSWRMMQDWSVKRERIFLVCMLLMQFGALGSFVSLDLLLFYTFWEIVLIPAYFLLGIFGGAERIKATTRFFVYTVSGSFLMLVGIIALAVAHQEAYGVASLSLQKLSEGLKGMNLLAQPGEDNFQFQALLFVLFGSAFFIKAPLIPFHGWMNLTYTQAPSPVAAFFAAVLGKLGIYGVLRFLWSFSPDVLSAWGEVLAWIAAAGIVYGAVLAIRSERIKSMLAYSSLSHVSFIFLGIFAGNAVGVHGAVVQMFGHGLVIAGLFLCLLLIEARSSKLGGVPSDPQLNEFGGLARSLPALAVLLFLFVMSSVALPGTLSFAGEFLILAGSFKAFPWTSVLAVLAMILGAVYMLRFFHKMMLGPEGTRNERGSEFKNPLSYELGFLAALAALLVWFGLRPSFLTDKILANSVLINQSNSIGSGEELGTTAPDKAEM